MALAKLVATTNAAALASSLGAAEIPGFLIPNNRFAQLVCRGFFEHPAGFLDEIVFLRLLGLILALTLAFYRCFEDFLIFPRWLVFASI